MKRMNLLAKAGLLFAASATLYSQAATTAMMTTMEATTDRKTPADGQPDRSRRIQASELPSMTVTAVNSDKELTYTETTAAGATSITFEVRSVYVS